MNRLISLGELRLALRLIVKQPILSVTIILALATGICVATMGFTFREELVSRTLPYANGERFARLYVLSNEGSRVELDLDRYHAFRDRAQSFEHVGAFAPRPFTVTHGPGDLESSRGVAITPRSMQWLEAAPLLGRALIPADGESGAERVVVIGEKMWQRRYGGDAQVIGRQITIGGAPRTVVGVMPASFQFPTGDDLWVPLDELTLGAPPSTEGRIGAAPGMRFFGVLRPGVTFDAANAEIGQLSSHFVSNDEPGRPVRMLVRPFTADSDGSDMVMSALVFVLVMVLMVVASNVATLIFARTWSRAPELAVRTALGAARSRVVGQLFFETLLLGAIAALVGLSGAWGILRYIRASLSDLPFWITLTPTPNTIAFVVLLTLLVGAVSGLLPALRVTRHDLRNTLHAGRGFAFGGFGKLGAALLVIEVALSVALLNGAVTMARAFESYVDEIPALPKNQVLTAQLGRIETPELRDRIIEAVAAMPGVVAAGAAQQLPRLYPQPRPTAVEALAGEDVMAAMPAPSHAVGHGFLEAIGARTVSGRLFTAADFAAGAAPVAIVNEPFVRRFLGGRNPIGRRIRIASQRGDGAEEPWREIVGVVPDLGLSVANASLAAGFYYPVHDEFLYHLAVRTSGDPSKLAPQLRAAVASVHPDAALEEIRTLEEAGFEERIFLSSIAIALTAMGGMALLLSIVGIYALLSFMVTRRTREIGIRVALGATSAQVVRSIVVGAAVYLLIGGALGSVLGVLFIELRALLLISIPDAGVWMPATIFLTLALAGAVACWVPVRRALTIRPSEALAAE
jgi:putative ABC transport system permease protein